MPMPDPMKRPAIGHAIRASMLVGFCALLALAAGAAEPQMTYAFQPSERHAQELAQIACREPHGVEVERIKAVTTRQNDLEQAFGVVECKPHDFIRGQPVRYSVDCRRSDKRWDCDEGALEFAVALGSKTLRVRPGKFGNEFAYDTIERIATAGNFQGVPLSEAMRSPCALSAGEKSELIEIRCTGVRVIASQWCPQGGCPRIISVDRSF